MWGFATDMRVQGDCATVLQQVLDIVEARADEVLSKKDPGADRQLGTGAKLNKNNAMAEGVGFEPTVPLQARRFSRPVP